VVVGVALGSGGDLLFGFNTTTGLLTALNGAVTPSGNTDTGIAFDGTSAFMYVSRVGATSGSSSVQSFSANASSGLTFLTGNTTGNSPGGLLVDNSSAYLYSADTGGATVSGFKVGATVANSSTGTLTPLTASPFGGGPSPSRLVEDKTHSYIVVTGTAGGADATLYQFDALTPGNLDAVGTVTSGSAGIVAVAATH
jgi:6-phosphogluconolactonase